MKIRFVKTAREELADVARYYNHELPGLGLRFLDEVRASLQQIKLVPEGWAKIAPRTRRCLIKVFPYALLYSIQDHEIIIFAVAHLRRDPKRYQDRIE